MKILLTEKIVTQLRRELRRARKREIGGLLMGEHVGDEDFRIVEISVQRSGGTAACFIRHPKDHAAQLEAFFERTGRDYGRYNYLGEWHSHPSFAAVPSAQDLHTMQSIVSDPSVGANFLVLMVPKLVGPNRMELSATAFRKDTQPVAVSVVAEPDSTDRRGVMEIVIRWVRDLLKV